MNPFKDTIYKVGKDGRVFQLHWKNRYDPVSMMLIAGTAMTAVGQIQQGYAAEAEGKAQQEIMNYNASLKEREAAAELARSREEARQFQLQGEEFKGQQQVTLAKGGVLTSQDTPAMLMETTAMNLDADRRRILEEGFLAESFRKSEAEGLRYQGRAAYARGKNAKTGSILTGIGTGLSGFGTYKALNPTVGSIPNKTSLATQLRY